MLSNKKYLTINDILNDEDFHLIEDKKKVKKVKTADDRLLSSFEEINAFYEINNREPQQATDINERGLYSRLNGIRSNSEKMEALKKYDKHNLLISEQVEKEKIESIDDILSFDPLGLLETNDEGLFDFKNVPNKEEMEKRAATDFVAKRKPCEDFDKYEPLFKKVQNDLKTGKRKLVEFTVGNLREQTYYVHNGILFFLEKIDISKKEHYREDGTRVREDGRTHCVFENGTESNMLKRSVEKILYDNGSVVTENADEVNTEIIERFNNITEEDSATGFIYILSSKSVDPKITEINNLYKIGYSTTPVEDRIKNAEKQPTYLMAPVKVEAVYQTYNMNTQKFEQLLHNFFGSACVNIDIYDEKSNRRLPQEWFVAPINIIDRAVELIITGEIVRYVYDLKSERISLKD